MYTLFYLSELQICVGRSELAKSDILLHSVGATYRSRPYDNTYELKNIE